RPRACGSSSAPRRPASNRPSRSATAATRSRPAGAARSAVLKLASSGAARGGVISPPPPPSLDPNEDRTPEDLIASRVQPLARPQLIGARRQARVDGVLGELAARGLVQR